MVNKRGVNFYLGAPNCGLIVSSSATEPGSPPAMIAVAIFPHQHTLGLGQGGMDAGFDSLSQKANHKLGRRSVALLAADRSLINVSNIARHVT
jgi:hypothetical protein